MTKKNLAKTKKRNYVLRVPVCRLVRAGVDSRRESRSCGEADKVRLISGSRRLSGAERAFASGRATSGAARLRAHPLTTFIIQIDGVGHRVPGGLSVVWRLLTAVVTNTMITSGTNGSVLPEAQT
ncbi:hypothetical protein EVAR_44319_1 [Eumeta japonica]|uniref:Uncharacterized protein n=1 Tax=Eumeta variegata TaxID=151549 RepID=A0A4C1XBR6_EUMVA|nr:hypothetical protein EVAR_44319_1 [Eumeta japonica]